MTTPPPPADTLDQSDAREHACHVGCTGGACETCPCCSAGWCVFGLDGLPTEPDDLSMWLDIAADHNPLVTAVRAVLDLADELEHEKGSVQGNVARLLAAIGIRVAVAAALAGGPHRQEDGR